MCWLPSPAGAEVTPHKAHHAYRVVEEMSFPLNHPDWGVRQSQSLDICFETVFVTNTKTRHAYCAVDEIFFLHTPPDWGSSMSRIPWVLEWELLIGEISRRATYRIVGEDVLPAKRSKSGRWRRNVCNPISYTLTWWFQLLVSSVSGVLLAESG